MTTTTETETVTRRVIVCDACGDRGKHREDGEGRVQYIGCIVCKRDFCTDCIEEHENSDRELRRIFSYDEKGSVLCKQCCKALKAEANLDGLLQALATATEEESKAIEKATEARKRIERAVEGYAAEQPINTK